MNPTDSPTHTNPASNGSNGNLAARLEDDKDAATETAKRDLQNLTDQAAADARELKEQAEEQLSAATEKAKSFAGEQKDLLAQQVNGVAAAISKVAGELEQSDQRAIARYARDLAGGLSKFGRNVEGKDVDDLMGLAQSFGREQPLAFLGAAALAGFVASRFAQASAHRQEKADAPVAGASAGQNLRDTASWQGGINGQN